LIQACRRRYYARGLEAQFSRVRRTNNRSTLDRPEQALAEALFLALISPGESEAQAASTLAEELAADFGLDAAAVKLAKAAALERFEHEATATQ
jgi:hypothetical protein